MATIVITYDGCDRHNGMVGLTQSKCPLCQVLEMREAMQEFVDRVDKGEVRSRRTYAKFKKILGSKVE